MAGEKMTTNPGSCGQGLKSDFPTKPEKDMASKKDVISHYGASAFVADQNIYYPPAAGCYYYPGFDGFPPVDDQGYLSTGVPFESGSPYYYNPYATGFLFSDGENPYIYGPESLDGGGKVAKKSENVLKPLLNGYNAPKTINTSFRKPSDWTLNSNAQEFSAPLKSLSQTLEPLYKAGYGFHTPGNLNGMYPTGKYSPFITSQNQGGGLMHYGSMNYQQNHKAWNVNQKFRPRYNYRQDGYAEPCVEITRGPRAKVDPSKKSSDEQKEQNVDRSRYNLEDFQTEYENAKFYVIKSYSEDDVHKSIEYSVWSSTPKGNKKLDSAFQDSDTKATETGAKHPVFLFFSVNGSGQFVGAAEMTGPVDFDKNMDFWQVDKWSGFFPLKWHIVKDLPNHLFRHIILENNEDRAVTHSRDTQEVGLKQGVEMLSIFKSYSAKSSLLDDFNFYENREKTLKARRFRKPDNGFPKLVNRVIKEEEEEEEESKTDVADTISVSLVNLIKNLSLEEHHPITC